MDVARAVEGASKRDRQARFVEKERRAAGAGFRKVADTGRSSAQEAFRT